jgi:hypothetical protein
MYGGAKMCSLAHFKVAGLDQHFACQFSVFYEVETKLK